MDHLINDHCNYKDTILKYYSNSIENQSYQKVIFTCKGNIHEPDFSKKLKEILEKLEKILSNDNKSINVTKVEPWNSVRVTLNLSDDDAEKLRQIAECGGESLREMGILSVQLDGQQVISLIMPNENTNSNVSQNNQSNTFEVENNIVDKDGRLNNSTECREDIINEHTVIDNANNDNSNSSSGERTLCSTINKIDNKNVPGDQPKLPNQFSNPIPNEQTNSGEHSQTTFYNSQQGNFPETSTASEQINKVQINISENDGQLTSNKLIQTQSKLSVPFSGIRYVTPHFPPTSNNSLDSMSVQPAKTSVPISVSNFKSSTQQNPIFIQMQVDQSANNRNPETKITNDILNTNANNNNSNTNDILNSNTNNTNEFHQKNAKFFTTPSQQQSQSSQPTTTSTATITTPTTEFVCSDIFNSIDVNEGLLDSVASNNNDTNFTDLNDLNILSMFEEIETNQSSYDTFSSTLYSDCNISNQTISSPTSSSSSLSSSTTPIVNKKISSENKPVPSTMAPVVVTNTDGSPWYFINQKGQQTQPQQTLQQLPTSKTVQTPLRVKVNQPQQILINNQNISTTVLTDVQQQQQSNILNQNQSTTINNNNNANINTNININTNNNNNNNNNNNVTSTCTSTLLSFTPIHNSTIFTTPSKQPPLPSTQQSPAQSSRQIYIPPRTQQSWRNNNTNTNNNNNNNNNNNANVTQQQNVAQISQIPTRKLVPNECPISQPALSQNRPRIIPVSSSYGTFNRQSTLPSANAQLNNAQIIQQKLPLQQANQQIVIRGSFLPQQSSQPKQTSTSNIVSGQQNTVASSSPLLVNLLQNDVPSNSTLQTLTQSQAQFVNSAPQQIKIISSSATHNEPGNRLMGLMLRMPVTSNVVSIPTNNNNNKTILSNVDQTNLIQNTVNTNNNNNTNTNEMPKPKKQRKPRKSKNQLENLPDDTSNSSSSSGNFSTTMSNTITSTIDISKMQTAPVSTLLTNATNQMIKIQSNTANSNLQQVNLATSSAGHHIFNQRVKPIVMINNPNNLDPNSATSSVSLVSSPVYYTTVSSAGTPTATSPSKSNKIILARKSHSFPVSSAMNSRITNPTSISQTLVPSLKLIHQPQSLTNTSLSTNELRTSNVQQPTTRLTSSSKSSLTPITTSIQTNLITSLSSLPSSSISSTAAAAALGNNTIFVTMSPTSVSAVSTSKANEQLIHDSVSTSSASAPLIRNLYKTLSIQKPGTQSSILLNQPNQVLAKMPTITLNTSTPQTIGIVQKHPMSTVSSNVQESTTVKNSKTPILIDMNKINDNPAAELSSKRTEMLESKLKTQSLSEMLDGSNDQSTSTSEPVFINCDTQLNENTIVSPSFFLESTYDKCDQIKSSDIYKHDSEQQSNKSLNEFEFNDFKSDTTVNISLPTTTVTNVTKIDTSIASNISSIAVSTFNSESSSALTETKTKLEEKAASPTKKNNDVFYVMNRNEPINVTDLPDHILDDGEDEDDTDDFDIYSNTKTYLTGSIGSFHKNNKITEINNDQPTVKNDPEPLIKLSAETETNENNFLMNVGDENDKKLFDNLNDITTSITTSTNTTSFITISQGNLKTVSKVMDEIPSQSNLTNGDILQESSNLAEENILSTIKNVDQNISNSSEEKTVVTTTLFQNLVASKTYPVLSINPSDVKTVVSTSDTSKNTNLELSGSRIKLMEKNKIESIPVQLTELKSQILPTSVSIQSDMPLKMDNKVTKGRRKTSDTSVKIPSTSSASDSNVSESVDSKNIISIDTNDKLILFKNHPIPIMQQSDSNSSPNSKLRLVCLPNQVYMVKPPNTINSGGASFKLINKSVAGQSSAQPIYLPLANTNTPNKSIFSNIKLITGAHQQQTNVNVTKTDSGDFSTKKVNVVTSLPEKETTYSSSINLNVRSQEISDSEKSNVESQKSSTETSGTESEISSNPSNINQNNQLDNGTQENIKCVADKKIIDELSIAKEVSNQIAIESAATTTTDTNVESKLNSSKTEPQITIIKPIENQSNVNISATIQPKKIISNENVVIFKTADNKEKLEQLPDNTGIRGQFLITKTIPKAFYNSKQPIQEASSQIFATKSNNATITATKTVPSILRQSKRKNEPTYQTITLGPQSIVKPKNNETDTSSFEMLPLDPNVVSFTTTQKYSPISIKESDEASDTSKTKKRARKTKTESVGNILPSTTTSFNDYEMNVLETTPNKITGQNDIKIVETPASNVRILRNSTSPKANVKRTQRNNRVLLPTQPALVPGSSVQSVTLNQNESISSDDKKVLTVMVANNRQTRSNRSRKRAASTTNTSIIQTESEISDQSAINIPSGSELETNINTTQLITGTIDANTTNISYLNQTNISVSDEWYPFEHDNSSNTNSTDASNNSLVKCRTRKMPINTNAKSSLRNTTVTDTSSAKRRRIKDVTK